MISYGNPVCAISNSRASLFCCKAACTKPAFACTQNCLFEEGHFDKGALHSIMPWRAIEEPIRLAMEPTLSTQELQHLENQQKRVKIIIEQLRAIHESHEKAIVRCKQRLHWKGIAEKVLTAVANKATQAIMGGDMAELLKAIESDNIFGNRRSVRKAAHQRNQLIDQLLTNLQKTNEEYIGKEATLTKPEQILTDDAAKLIPTVDIANSSAAVTANNVISVKVEKPGYHPVFSREQLGEVQTFSVEVVEDAGRDFLVGVATSELRNCKNQYKHINSLCVYAYDGTLYSDGKSRKHQFKLNTGDVLTVRRNTLEIEWLRGGHLLCSAPIPSRLSEAALFPVLWIGSGSNAADISKLRFV